MFERDEKTTNEIFAEALIQIIENQIELKKHLGLVHDTDRYGDCYSDHETIRELKGVE